MIPSSDPNATGESAARRPAAVGSSSSTGLLIAVLALGMLTGFAMGWISFGSPWSAVTRSPALYDETLVTGLFDEASRAVVEIIVERTTLPRRESSGSGFLVDVAGHIVTNHHVVDGAGEITVRLFDGRSLPTTWRSWA